MGKPNKNNKGKKGKGSGKPNSKPKDTAPKEEQGEAPNTQSYKGNHFEYYNGYPALLENASKVVTSNILGDVLYLGSPSVHTSAGENAVEPTYRSEAFPGIMRIDTLFGPGYSLDINSAVNRAATDLHMYVASKRSAAIKNYDSASLIMMVNALDSAIVWFSVLKRLYYTIKKNSPYNLYYRKALIHAQGFDFEELKDNLPILANIINDFSVSMARYQIPKFYIQDRHRWLFENYFCDDDISHNPKAQLFFYRPSGLYFLYETDIDKDRGITRLRYKDWDHLVNDTVSTPILGLANIASITQRFTGILNYSSDFYMIMSDIMNAYESADLVTWDFIDDSDYWDPIYDEEAIIQLHNANITGKPQTNGECDITQEFDEANPSFYIRWAPYTISGHHTATELKLRQLQKLDFLSEPDTELITRSSRFLTTYKSEEDIDPSMYPGAQGFMCGTEVVTTVSLFCYEQHTEDTDIRLYEHSTSGIATSNIVFINMLTDYTLAPKIYYSSSNTKEGGVTYYSYQEFWNVHDYAYVPNSTIYMLHRACVMSEWRVKEVENLKF